MDKDSRLEIRIAEDLKARAHAVALSQGHTLSEYVLHLIKNDITQREEEIDLEARKYSDNIQEWSARSGKPVAELLGRIKNFATPTSPKRDPYEIARELEGEGKKQTDIARILNQQGYTYHDGLPFTQPRVWHLLNPNGYSERADRVGRP